MFGRVAEYIKSRRISPHELARILGINPQSVYNYLAGTSKAPLSFIVLFLESFPDVSAEWLLRGEGEMLKPTRQSHYLEMAARVNSTYMASEETESPKQLYNDAMALIRDLRREQDEQRQRIDELAIMFNDKK